MQNSPPYRFGWVLNMLPDAEIFFLTYITPWCKRRCAVNMHQPFSSLPRLLNNIKKCKIHPPITDSLNLWIKKNKLTKSIIHKYVMVQYSSEVQVIMGQHLPTYIVFLVEKSRNFSRPTVWHLLDKIINYLWPKKLLLSGKQHELA